MHNNCNCFIIDDEQDSIELLSDRLTKLYKNITIADTFTHWEDALAALREQTPDLLFMDISMPGKNSIELLKLLPGLDCEIIFVTAHEQYAIDAFAFATSGYILKPIDDMELSAAINKALGRIKSKKQARQNSNTATIEKIGISNNHGVDYIDIRDILYLESEQKCTKIVTEKAEYLSSYHLGRYKNLIDKHAFFQVHRSYIVNLNCVLRFESSGYVIMSNKKEIPVSRNVRNEFLDAFNVGY